MLYRNTGTGRFSELPNAGGADSALWSTSCAFARYRPRRRPRFLRHELRRRRLEKEQVLRRPQVRRNQRLLPSAHLPAITEHSLSQHRPLEPPGAGKTFEDISTQSGVASASGNGLGVAAADMTTTAGRNLFIANDAVPNFLFHDDGTLGLTEMASLRRRRRPNDGEARAGMGTAFGDYSGNRQPN